MVKGGVRYGYVTTGEAIIFLQIPSDDPTCLNYHLADHRVDVLAQLRAYPDEDYFHGTALGQILAFSVQALESKTEAEEWRQNVISRLTP